MISGLRKCAGLSKPALSSSGILSTVRIELPIRLEKISTDNWSLVLAYGQMTNNLTSQAATLRLDGIPNDIILNLDPLALLILIPIMDYFIYPGIRKLGIRFTPIKRIFTGFMVATLSMASATVIQYYIYRKSPCGDHPSHCPKPTPISVWVQALPYVLVAFSEIFTSITGYEYAFTKAPRNMKSLGRVSPC